MKFNHPSAPVLAFLLFYIVHPAFYGASIGDALVVLGLLGLYGYFHYLDTQKKAPIGDDLKAEVALLKDTVNAMKVSQTFARR